MSQHDAAAIAVFIRTKGVSRCPTACAAPTQAAVTAADRWALRRRAEQREAAREAVREERTAAPGCAELAARPLEASA